jgi:hypothetical protein
MGSDVMIKPVLDSIVIDTIKNYLNNRGDVKFEDFGLVPDYNNSDSVVDKYHIKVFAPVSEVNSMYALHHLIELGQFAMDVYDGLKNNTHLDNFMFEDTSDTLDFVAGPKIIYNIEEKETNIIIKSNGCEIQKKGMYRKQVELEFF